MGTDPLEAIVAPGSALYYVHAKGTHIEERSSVRSLLEPLTLPIVEEWKWNFVAVERGHDVDWWTTFDRLLASVGYDATLSIEHEDARVTGVDGVREAAQFLTWALAKVHVAQTSDA